MFPSSLRPIFEKFETPDKCEVIGQGALAKVYKIELPGTGVVAFKKFHFGLQVCMCVSFIDCRSSRCCF